MIKGFNTLAIFDYYNNSIPPFTKIVLPNIKHPTNNDGRSTCFKCGQPTKKVEGFSSFYDICPKCQI